MVKNYIGLGKCQREVLFQGLCPLQSQEVGQVYRTRHEFLPIEKNLSPIRGMLVTLQDKRATIALLGMSFQGGHCRRQTLQLGRTVDCSCPLAACIVTSATMRSGPQGGGFQASSSSVTPILCSKCMVSSAIGSLLRVLGSNQRQWQ